MNHPVNQPAFPVAEDHKVADALEWTQGMQLRDYFAAKAIDAAYRATGHYTPIDAQNVAALAYEIADAMLKAREVQS